MFIAISWIGHYLCVATSQAIASSLPEEEESPDSTEQCTGEEPGDVKASTESATENNCQLPLRKKRAGVRLKM